MIEHRKIRSTTILGVRSKGKVAVAGDGQVTLGDMAMKQKAIKVRKFDSQKGGVVGGFAGAAADALTLFEKFANIRIRNEMAPGTEGGFTKLYPEEKVLPVYDAVVEYKKRGTDLVVIGGKEYGTGSSRDWAAKGTKLLGIKAVIAESFERIHRSNLIGMGILPLQFIEDVNRKNLKLIGSELISILNIEKGVNPSDEVTVEIKYASGEIKKIKTLCRIDTKNELEYYKNGGILQYVLRNMI